MLVFGMKNWRVLKERMRNNLPIGTMWKNCRLIYNPNDNSYSVPNIYQYVQKFPDALDTNIWVDQTQNTLFSQAQYREGPAGKDHHFSDSESKWLTSKWGMPFVEKHKSGFKNAHEIYASSEIIYSNFDHIEQTYEDKRILIVGGGRSAGIVEWYKTDYDYVWSMNHFYQKQPFWDHQPNLVTIATNVDLRETNKKLHDFMEHSPETKVYFEIERGDDPRAYEDMKWFCERYPDRTEFFHTRYRSQPGVALRLLVFAVLAGAKAVKFVGIDGFEGQTNDHYFEGSKGNPNWYKNFGPNFQDRQFVIWFDFLKCLQERRHFHLENLAQNLSFNQIREITEKW